MANSSSLQPDSVRLDHANCVDFSKKKITSCSLFIENGLIKAMIPAHEIMPAGTRSVDLKGRFVIPGFTDAHTHLISSGIEMQRLDLGSCRSLDDCLQKVRDQAKKRALVFASNWDETTWRRDERERLSRQALDKISKRTPIIMRRICGHYAVANTAALRRIDKRWHIVDRRHGLLYEDVVLNLNDIFSPSESMLEKALFLATRKALRLGITSVHEIANPKRFRLLQKHRKNLKLKFAVYLTEKYHSQVVASGLRTGYGNSWLRFCGTKVFIDGSIGARTAALNQKYANTRQRGRLLLSTRRLEHLIRDAEMNGIQLMIHSIGDRSTDLVLDILERNMDLRNPLRHRLEHLEMLSCKAVTDIGRLKIIASMQPNFVKRWQYPGGFYSKVIGPGYLKMNCFRSLLKARARVLFGSDCMPMGPLYGIKGAVSHPSACGKINIADAFRLYTESAAYATFEENQKGKLEPGYCADLAVLDLNPLEERNLDQIRIQSVMVGGRFVKI